MKTMRSLLILLCLAAFPLTNTGYAFIDTSSMEESLRSLEQDLSGDSTGLGLLLEELDQAAGQNAALYLSVTVEGETTVMWDVPKNAWFYSSVQALSDLGIVSGYRNAEGKLTGSYKPGNNVTHAEAIKIAVGIAGIDPTSCGAPSHPGAGGHWAAAFVACAEARNFGLTAGTDLNAPASRAEVLHYFLTAFRITVPEGNPPFGDSKNHRSRNDIAYAYALEIVSGDTNPDGSEKGTFRPDAAINRAETAKIARLAMELL